MTMSTLATNDTGDMESRVIHLRFWSASNDRSRDCTDYPSKEKVGQYHIGIDKVPNDTARDE